LARLPAGQWLKRTINRVKSFCSAKQIRPPEKAISGLFFFSVDFIFLFKASLLQVKNKPINSLQLLHVESKIQKNTHM